MMIACWPWYRPLALAFTPFFVKTFHKYSHETPSGRSCEEQLSRNVAGKLRNEKLDRLSVHQSNLEITPKFLRW
jgi:hypothetical protein